MRIRQSEVSTEVVSCVSSHSSKLTRSSPDVLQKKLLVSKAFNDNVTEEKNKYSQLFEEVKETALQNEAKVCNSWIIHGHSSSSGHC